MSNLYGDDFITITDEEGTEYELEVLHGIEYNGSAYLAVIPAGQADEEELEVSILKAVNENGEEILCAIEDDQELETVYQLMMDELDEDESDEN